MLSNKALFFMCSILIHQQTFSIGGQLKVTDQVYFDVSRDGEPLGRIIIGLFGELAPKTVDNFKHIATIGIDGKSYAGTYFHRIIKRFMIQGGDILQNNGLGSISIFGPTFEDENLETEFKISGLVAMANKGMDTNGCQFFITTVATPWLNGLHTIFGKVIDGQSYVHIIEHESTDVDDHPRHSIMIDDCGLIETPTPFYTSDEPYDIWAWIRASAIPLSMSFTILGIFHWMIKKIEV